MGLTIEGADEIDHRIDSEAVDLIDVAGAERIGDIHVIGRTRSLRLRPTGGTTRPPLETTYQIRYLALLTKGREDPVPALAPHDSDRRPITRGRNSRRDSDGRDAADGVAAGLHLERTPR